MKVAVWLALAASPGWAHMMSMSSGDLTVDGARAHYELRMPLYEMAHVADPAHGLLDHVRFSSAGREAKRVAQSCRTDQAGGVYLCTADYDFGAPVERVDVECTLSHGFAQDLSRDGLAQRYCLCRAGRFAGVLAREAVRARRALGRAFSVGAAGIRDGVGAGQVDLATLNRAPSSPRTAARVCTLGLPLLESARYRLSRFKPECAATLAMPPCACVTWRSAIRKTLGSCSSSAALR